MVNGGWRMVNGERNRLMTPKWQEVLAWRNERDRQAADEGKWMTIKRFQPNS